MRKLILWIASALLAIPAIGMFTGGVEPSQYPRRMALKDSFKSSHVCRMAAMTRAITASPP